MDSKRLTEFLSENELFKDLQTPSLDELAGAASTQQYRRGEAIFKAGENATALHIVVSGRVALVGRSFDGRESVMSLVESHGVIGELALFGDRTRLEGARSLTNSEVLTIPTEALIRLYTEYPGSLWRVITLLSNQARQLRQALGDSVFLDVTGRTAKQILKIAGENEEFNLPVTQEELAGMVGASRERVNKAIASFIKLGWLEQRERHYKILNRQQLEIRSQ